MTVSHKHVDFAKDNLARIVRFAKNDAENEYKVEDEDGET